MYSQFEIDHVGNLLEDIDEYNLTYDIDFKKASINALMECYNGCGPDWLPDWMRKLLTEYFEFFEAAFLIHDWDYTYLEKTRENFDAANYRMLDNCMRMVKCKVSAWRFLQRMRRRRQAIELYEACDSFGYEGFLDMK